MSIQSYTPAGRSLFNQTTSAPVFSKPAKTKIIADVEHITPMRAKEYLDRAKDVFKNRPIRNSRIKKYVQQILSGEWEINGEGIKFDEDGIPIDGQHRLLAIIASNTAIDTFVFRNLPRKAFDTFDTGSPRSGGDAVAKLDASNPNSMSAAIGWIIRIRGGRVFVANDPISNKETASFYDNNEEELERAISIAYKAKKFISPGLGAALYFLFSEKDQAEADSFYEEIISGIYSKPNNSAHLLREQLQENRATKVKLPIIELAAKVIRAWNYRRQGVNPRMLKGTVGSGSLRQFPDII